MATTRIMPLHIGKGRTESRAISDIIDYVANPQKTDNGKLITGYGCDSRTADAEFLLAKRQYIAATGRVRGADDVIAYHMPETLPEPFQRSAFPTPPIQLQISSLIKISSICAVNVFISPTQRIGSQAFSSSVTPAASIM